MQINNRLLVKIAIIGAFTVTLLLSIKNIINDVEFHAVSLVFYAFAGAVLPFIVIVPILLIADLRSSVKRNRQEGKGVLMATLSMPLFMIIFITTAILVSILTPDISRQNIQSSQEQYEKSKEEQYITPTPVAPTYIKPVKAPNGQPWPSIASYVKGFKKMHTNGLSRITIDNSQNNSDVFIKLVAINELKSYPVRVFFIPAFSQFTIKNIRAGLYDIRYRDLDSGSLSKSESFVLEEIKTYDGVEYSNLTMTLYKIQNGNMQTYGLSEEQF